MDKLKSFKARSFTRADHGLRKPIEVNDDTFASVSPLFDDENGPLKIKANYRDVNLTEWSKQKRKYIEEKLYKHGAILFRGFSLYDDYDFVKYIESVPYQTLNYLERSSPRAAVSEKVYTSTVYPKDQSIALHNENTASMTFALKVWFFCANAPSRRGETPIADSRKILSEIDPDVLDKFRSLGWCLIRNYGNNLGYGWRDAFDGKSTSEVEEYCKSNNIEMEWRDNNRLWTKQVRSATITHPHTQEETWFNHIAFWHPANLDPEMLNFMLKEVGEQGLPYYTCYGDGSEIPDDIAHHLRDAYRKQKKMFSWRNGDLLLLDNVLYSHGREPYDGDRRIRVALADGFTRPDFSV